MENNENTVQIQVEVLRAQLDKLIADINSLKNQNISVKVDTAGAAALEQLSDAVQQMRTGLQELDAQLGQNAAAFSGMGNSAQAAVQALLQYISQVNQAASAEMQALAVRRQTTAATEEQASAAGTAAQAVSQMADAQRQESDADAQFLARLTAGNSALEDRAGQIRQLIDLYAQMQRIRASGAAGQSVPMLEAGDYEVFGQGTSHGPTVAQGSVIDVDWTDAARGAREYAGAASDAADATGQAVTQSDGLVDSFGRLFPQLTVWQLTRDAVNALVQELKAALETMKDVDTELTAIQKVTNNTDAQMSKIGEHGYDVASKYGVSVTDYLSSVGSFSKAGYKEMSEDMAELATKTQLVGDVNADTANKFLLSADAAFKLEGNVAALSKVLDAANTIENEYATEIQKIAEGFPLVANVASMANMTAEQLTAALGTITAATQESGSMAARAMRALILNIMGDTETELEDGITWTKDEIESLSQILWTYSEDAMKAAQATGSIVNPMEAVAGLAKAYKEGVLTQAELAQFESDLGGKLRTNQLDALIQHYDMYLEMLDKVTTSAGSADREIGTMLDSWQSKANILDNKWTELVNHMIETESVKGGLETVTELVELLDTDLGHIILTLAAAETGVFAIAAAVKSFQRVGSVLQLGSLSPWLLGIGAAITGIVVAVQAAQKAYEITGVNPDGSYTSKLVDANQTIWNYDGQYDTVSGNNSGNTTGGGQKYTGTVWAKRNDGNGVDYKISSARGLDFLNNEPAGATMTGSDGSYWVKNADGTTSITNKYGVGFTVYDKGGILHGMGGIKATMQDEGITPPDVTAMLKKRVLTPVEDRNFSQNMDSIRWMMASNRTSANEVHNASYDSHNIGTMIAKQINCTINGMKVSPQEAHALTLEKLANIAHNLGNFS